MIRAGLHRTWATANKGRCHKNKAPGVFITTNSKMRVADTALMMLSQEIDGERLSLRVSVSDVEV